MGDVWFAFRASLGSAVAGLAFALSPTVVLAGPPPATTPTAELREQDVPAYEAVANSEPLVGWIVIPRVGVSSVILQGVDYKTIRRAVGHFPTTPLAHQRGNMALAAHRTTDFYGLRNIRLGDEIKITSPHGDFRYVVASTKVVDPRDVSVLDPSPDKVLTLVTCFPFDYPGTAPQRFIVRAQAVEPPTPAAPPAVAEPPAVTAAAAETQPAHAGIAEPPAAETN